MCRDLKNWTTYCSANQKELRWQAATNYNLQSLPVAHKSNQIRIMERNHFVENCNEISHGPTKTIHSAMSAI